MGSWSTGGEVEERIWVCSRQNGYGRTDTYRTNKTALREYVKANEEVFSKLEEDTFDLLTVMSGIRAMKLIKRDVETVGGELWYSLIKLREKTSDSIFYSF